MRRAFGTLIIVVLSRLSQSGTVRSCMVCLGKDVDSRNVASLFRTWLARGVKTEVAAHRDTPRGAGRSTAHRTDDTAYSP